MKEGTIGMLKEMVAAIPAEHDNEPLWFMEVSGHEVKPGARFKVYTHKDEPASVLVDES